MIKKISILIGCALFIFSTLVSADAGVSFSEKKVKSRVGEQFSLDVLMTDFPTTEGGGVVLSFNPKVVQVTSVSVDGTVWGFVNRNGEIDNDNGGVSGILFSDYRGVAGNAKIATIQFESIHKGKSRIRLEESADNPFASDGANIAVKFKSTKIRVRRQKRH